LAKHLQKNESIISKIKNTRVKKIVKGATKVSGHFFKLYLFIFENSQEKQSSLDCQYGFSNRLHYLQSLNAQNLMQIKIIFTCLMHSII
jgi:hypothetical protein